MKDKTIFGAICGDVLGSVYESRRFSTKDYHFELFSPYARFTDDTVLTVAVAEWILCDPTLSHKTLTKSIVKWALKYLEA